MNKDAAIYDQDDWLRRVKRKWVSSDGISVAETAIGTVWMCVGDKCYVSYPQAVDVDVLVHMLKSLGFPLRELEEKEIERERQEALRRRTW